MATYSSPQRGQVDPAGPGFNTGSLVTAAIVVAGLYFSRDVLLPFVVAVILSFVLAIPVRMLQGFGLGRTFPIAAVVIVAFVAFLAIGGLLASQLADLASDLPRYQSTIREKITSLKGAAAGGGPLERLAEMLQNLSDDFAPKPEAAPARNPGDPAAAQQPVPVEITKTRTSPIATITGYVTPLLHPLATASLVIVFTVFILMQRGDLRNRAIRLAGSQDLQRTTAAMNEAARRLSQFFLVQVLLNSAFGVAVGLGLWAIGVPSPILWGVMAAISRFVPYIGVILAAGGPLLLAAAVDPSWSMLVYTAVFFICAEVLVGQVVEPLVYGHSTGLSPVAVIASVTFWTWLWGPIGLILAMPLTVCLVVLGRHVEHLEFLDVMLGDRPPLTVAEVFYQRVLAGDAGEAYEQAEMFLKDHALATYYDEVAIKGLALGQVDLARGALDEAAVARIQNTCAQLIEEVSEHETVDANGAEAKKVEVKRAVGDEDLDKTLESADTVEAGLPVLAPGRLPPGWEGGAAVLCLGGRNELDRIGAAMLAQILGKHGLPARVEGSEALTAGGMGRESDAATKIVCLSYLDTSSPVHVRYAIRRLRRRYPQARIIIGSWGLATGEAKGLCEAARSDSCASRLIEAAQFCLEQASSITADETKAEPSAAPLPQRSGMPSSPVPVAPEPALVSGGS
ncbi:AI-2E family transporter [uncultured Enterovirga sp.]|uniref:AI-2E family transporter n=1 Tax=uncultured Enterovirga sp. TaxID=2026352 RepID=UPI0035CB4CA4